MKRLLNHDFFASVDSETKAWLLGFIATDGSVYGNALAISLGRKDRPTLDRIRVILGSDASIWDYTVRYDTPKYRDKEIPASRLTVYSPRMVADLLRQGIHQNKTQTLKFWDGPAELLPYYVRGLIDGDGSIYTSKQKNCYVAFFGTHHVCAGIVDFIHSQLSISPGYLQPKKKGWEVKYWGQIGVQKIVTLLYRGATVALPKKQKRAEKIMASTYREYHYRPELTREEFLSTAIKHGSWKAGAAAIGIPVGSITGFRTRLGLMDVRL